MLTCFYRNQSENLSTTDLQQILDTPNQSIIWVDSYHASEKEKLAVEEKLGVELFTRQEAEEIESSSKYFEDEQEINANLNYLYKREEGRYATDPVSFILKSNYLITQRNIPLRSFEEAKRFFRLSKKVNLTGYNVFLAMFEARIDVEADFLEDLSKKIYAVGKNLALDKELEEEVLIEIYNFQEIMILFRETTSEMKRLFSSILRSEYFPTSGYEKVRVLIKDADSLLGHTSFNFERLEYLQNTFMGLIDIEQNQIIKIFTVMTVVIMPPTLIASLYGMNFEYIPELGWEYGYPFAIGLMILSSLLTLFYFRRKKWL